MATNLPTPPTHEPRRVAAGTLGSLPRSRAASFCSVSGDSAAPAISATTPLRSAMLPSGDRAPGRSAPAEPKRTNFMVVLGRRQTGGSDRFELLVGEDEFLVAQRLGLRQFAVRDLLHQLVDLATDVIES